MQPVDRHAAGVRVDQSGEQAKQGGLSRTVDACQRESRAGTQVEVDAGEEGWTFLPALADSAHLHNHRGQSLGGRLQARDQERPLHAHRTPAMPVGAGTPDWVIARMPVPSPELWSRMRAVASLRELTPSFANADERWLLTVLSATKSFRAISPFVKPSTTIARICF